MGKRGTGKRPSGRAWETETEQGEEECGEGRMVRMREKRKDLQGKGPILRLLMPGATLPSGRWAGPKGFPRGGILQMLWVCRGWGIIAAAGSAPLLGCCFGKSHLSWNRNHPQLGASGQCVGQGFVYGSLRGQGGTPTLLLSCPGNTLGFDSSAPVRVGALLNPCLPASLAGGVSASPGAAVSNMPLLVAS